MLLKYYRNGLKYLLEKVQVYQNIRVQIKTTFKTNIFSRDIQIKKVYFYTSQLLNWIDSS